MKLETKVGDAYDVGDILSCSWGFDQTNVQFYKIDERHVTPKGDTFLVMREIAAVITPDKSPTAMTGRSLPEVDPMYKDKVVHRYIGESQRRKLHFNPETKSPSYVKLSNYQYAMAWRGEPKFTSWYG